MNKENIIKGSAIAAIGLLAGASGAMLMAEPQTIEVVKEVPTTVTVEKEIPGPTQFVYATEYVDNGKLEDVLQAIYDSEGNMSLVTEDLDEEEIHLIADRVIMQNEMLVQAENAAREKAVAELHKENINGTLLLREDIKSVSVDYDLTEVTVLDWEEKDAEAFVTVHFTQDRVKYKAVLAVYFEGGIVDDVELESVELR